jgi:arginase
MKAPILLMMFFTLPFLALTAQPSEPGKIKVAIVKNDSEGPRAMAEGGLVAMLESLGCEIRSIDTVVLTEEEEKQYGDWNRGALESGHIGHLVAKNRRDESLIIGLLTNCTDLLGMLAGLQHLRPAEGPAAPDQRSLQREGLAGIKPLRVGLVYFDAHADFNTPETTLSGMLGGMPVAISAGLCLTRLRMKAGLDPALPTKYIVFGCLRDVDPLEQELLDRSQCEFLSVEETRSLSEVIDKQIKRLSLLTDVIYVHVDMDVLDPAEVRGHSLTVSQGPTSKELAGAIRKMFAYPKVAAIGIASLPFGPRDKEGISLKAAYRLIEGAVKGVRGR